MPRFHIRFVIRNFMAGLKNLFTWFPIIWNDRQYDHSFFFKILDKKLALMEKNFKEAAITTSAPRNARDMHVCRLLIDRITKDDYSGKTLQHEDILLDQDVEYLFKIIRKQVRGWWW